MFSAMKGLYKVLEHISFVIRATFLREGHVLCVREKAHGGVFQSVLRGVVMVSDKVVLRF